jgi:hypothetical protein
VPEGLGRRRRHWESDDLGNAICGHCRILRHGRPIAPFPHRLFEGHLEFADFLFRIGPLVRGPDAVEFPARLLQ